MFCAIVDPIPTVSVTVNSDMNAGKLGDQTAAVRAASAAVAGSGPSRGGERGWVGSVGYALRS